ncbi:radical SAM protein [Halobacteriales archaeon QS_5_70_15]|nr:MAG: radical SAM protein [Halobacteriales archaeon QS_5_70_15]
MSSDRRELGTTTSLCPACLEPAPGRYEERDGSVYLTRTCEEHGVSTRRVWESVDHWEWAGELGPEPAPEDGTGRGGRDGEAADVGDLTVDNDHACLAVVEVTTDCNLSCSYCFAGSGPGGEHLPAEEVIELLEVVRSEGGPRPIQFSGGEPTVREDLPDLVERAGEMGFEHVQVNTNGIRIATEDGYAQRLADAGVTAVYLQFDGVEADTYEEIRGVDLSGEKREAVEACRRAGLSVVLVPTVVPGVNDHEMGNVVEFALENLDTVESVNFQPVAHFGRYAEHDGRFPLDEAARLLAGQVDGLEARDLLPIPCCSSYCQMATALLPGEGGAVPATGLIDDETYASLSGLVDEADWMELLANTPAGGERACSAAGCCGADVPEGADALLGEVLPVSLTGFMDADAADVDRLGNCCIAVPTASGDLVPFCAYNMSTEGGEYAVRNREGWGGRTGVEAPLPDAPEGTTDGGIPRSSAGDGGPGPDHDGTRPDDGWCGGGGGGCSGC